MFYIMYESDLRHLSHINIQLYAYEINLFVPETTNVHLAVEFDSITRWVSINKMAFNLEKYQKIVFHRPNPKLISWYRHFETNMLR